MTETQAQVTEATEAEVSATIQRPLKGSRIATFYPVKQFPALASLDSAFQLQEYISLLVRLDPHNVEAITSLPGQSAPKESGSDSAKAEDGDKSKGEVTVDQWCWVYEQLRRLAQDLTHPLITTLQQECNRASCPEMKAGEWLYLCVAHGNEGSMEQCCAIDYILHTLDSATALLNSPRAFPSRIQIPETSQRHFGSLARRLGRIFAHAYFHHREAFEQAEAESSLYSRFLALASKFDLVPAEFLPIPPEGFYPPLDNQDEERHPRNAPPPKLLAAAPQSQSSHEVDGEQRQQEQQEQLKSILQHESTPSSLHLEPPRDGNASPNPPGLASPRRAGRNRTDTMVFSDAEAQSFAEQLGSRSGNSPEEGDTAESSSAEEKTDVPPITKSFAEVAAEKVEEPTPQEVDLVDLTTSSAPAEASQEAPKAAASDAPSASETKPEEEQQTEEVPAPEAETETEDSASEMKAEEAANEEALSELPPVNAAPSELVSETVETAPATSEDPVSDSGPTPSKVDPVADEPTEKKAPADESKAGEDKEETAPKAPTSDSSEKDASKEVISS